MKCKVVSLLIDAPLVAEPAGKDIGILGACLEFDRKNLFTQNFGRRGMGGGRTETWSTLFND